MNFLLTQPRKLLVRTSLTFLTLLIVVPHPEESHYSNARPKNGAREVHTVTNAVHWCIPREVCPGCNEATNVAEHDYDNCQYPV